VFKNIKKAKKRIDIWDNVWYNALECEEAHAGDLCQKRLSVAGLAEIIGAGENAQNQKLKK
jgi:hypothetical protein